MIELDSKRKLSYYSSLETRSLKVLQLMKSIFGPVPINPVNFAHSILNENWPHFIIFNAHFTVNSPLVPCILSDVNLQSRGLLKLFYDYPNLFWEHVNNIPSRPLTNITKGPEYAVTSNFTTSVQAEMDFRHYLSPYCFID